MSEDKDDGKDSTKNVNKGLSSGAEINIPKTSLTVTEVAAWLKVSEEAVVKYITDKKLSAHKVSNQYFITEEDLFSFNRILIAFSKDTTTNIVPINNIVNVKPPLSPTPPVSEVKKVYAPVKINLPAFNRILECLTIVKKQRSVLGEELYLNVISTVQSSIEFCTIGYFLNGEAKVMTYRKSMEALSKGIAILYVNGGMEAHAITIQAFLEASDAMMTLSKKIKTDNKTTYNGKFV